MRIEIVYALPRRCWSESLELPHGATVADALALTRLREAVPGLVVNPALLAVHGQAATPQRVLADGDRLEILRPLTCDPREVRRRRAARQPDAQRRRRSSFSRGRLP